MPLHPCTAWHERGEHGGEVLWRGGWFGACDEGGTLGFTLTCPVARALAGCPAGSRRASPAPDAERRSRRPADPAARAGGRAAGDVVEAMGASHVSAETERPHGTGCVDIDAPPTMRGRSRGASEPTPLSADHEHGRPRTPDAPIALLFRARAQSPALLRRHVLPAHHSPHRFKVRAR